MSLNSENGIVTIPSHQSVDQTVQTLEGILKAKGVKLFALIDHSGEAEKAGMQMHPAKLVIFGSPRAGTPPHDRVTQHRDRSSAESTGPGGRRG